MRHLNWFLFLLSTFGCAPLGYLRPPGELLASDRSFEVGAGAVRLGPRPYVIEEWHTTGQGWVTAAVSRSVELTALGAFDDSGAAAGAAVRWTPLHLRSFALGGEIDLGYAWGAVGLPIGVRPVQRLWIYSAPRLGNQGVRLTPVVPVGVSLRTVDALMLRGEASWSWADFQSYQRRLHLAAGLAYQF
jgi:hypothetical protein